MLVVRASQRATIDWVCHQSGWLLHDGSKIEVSGMDSAPWDENVAAQLEAYGCPAALVQHHVKAGAANHIVAAYECLLHAGKDAAVQQPAAGAAA